MSLQFAHQLAQIIFWTSFVYHLVVGLAAICSLPLLRKIAVKLYRLTLPEHLDPRYEYTLKPLGLYALFLSACCYFAATSEVAQVRDFMTFGLALMLLARAYMRVRHYDLLTEAFAVTSSRNWLNVAFNTAVATALLSTHAVFWQ